MQKKLRFMFQRLQYAFLLLILFSGLVLVNGVLGTPWAAAASSDSKTVIKTIIKTETGIFLDSPVSGLNYSSFNGVKVTFKGLTGPAGEFKYKTGDTVTFSIGTLTLGSATGAPELTPMDILGVPDNPLDQSVINMCVLLQTLDQDGDLNNNIQITKAIAAIVSGFAVSINFNQSPDAFAADSNVAALLAALNAASPAVFSDGFYRGPRTLQPYAEASAHFARSLSPRITVHTANGLLSGYAANADTWQFLGVPYAAKPIGSLRWRPPHAPASWSGVRQAIEWGDQSPQITTYTTGPYAALIGAQGGVSEDCLHLNITTPMGGSNLPVMVWFHGGAFVILTGNSPNYNNPAGLTTKGVVVVTVNHRLGEFGYLAHPLLTKESGYHGSGNYGQLDLIAALQWVKHNIAKFGGDPNNVTIFGESGGGGKVNSLMASPLAKGLFHKAICESGMFPNGAYPSPFFFLNTPPLAVAEYLGTTLFSTLGVSTLAQARAIPWWTIVAEDTAYWTAYYAPTPFQALDLPYAPNQDNHYAKTDMYTSLATKLPSDVPFLAGANAGDMTGLIPGLVEQMPLRAANNSSPQYVYKFAKVPEGWAKAHWWGGAYPTRDILAYHSDELSYVFNYPQSPVADYYLTLVMDQLTSTQILVYGIPFPDMNPYDVVADAGWGKTDDTMADQMMDIWTSFARTGIPSTTTFIWPRYTVANDTYVEIGASYSKSTALTPQVGLSGAGDPWLP